ncbi:hypothetical protein GQ55_3G122900 [Panicum hallii var. hallii]|uniref:Uncharacterized protein n=1 Tax=Panicum hallii var. hallii TaxID=1504633 RepID=A0A2T7E8M6_9POAL|nr:hypothetical protein GQ55_3G122900 [Panicum hallii var. hallii]
MKLAMAAARNNSSAGKKPRKPYKITRPREMWAADEHGRFLHALLLFGRDWKPVAQFVGTKTATQVRSHAQKHFLKAQKLGLGAALPPPKPRRGAVLAAHSPSSVRHDDNAVAGTAAAQMWWPTAATPRTMSCTDCAAPSGAAQQGASAGSRHWPSRSGGEPGGAGSAAGAMAQEDETMIQLPLSPDDPRFAQVYRFVGDVFGSGAVRPAEAELQRLEGVDPVVVDARLDLTSTFSRVLLASRSCWC